MASCVIKKVLRDEVHAFSTRSIKNLPSKDEQYFVKRFDLDKRESLV